MSRYLFCLAILATISLYIGSTDAVTCFHCDSRNSLACRNGENFDPSENRRELDEFGNDCHYCTEATFKILGGTVVQRRCENENFDLSRYGLDRSNDCAPAWFYDIEGEMCVCDKDKCNSGAGDVTTSLVALIFTLIVGKLLL